MFSPQLDLTGIHHYSLPLPTTSSSSQSPSNVYNPWQNSPHFASSSPFHQQQQQQQQHSSSLTSDPIRRSFHNFTYHPFQDDRISNSRLLPMLPYPSRTSFSSTQHIPNSASVDDRSSTRSLTASYSPPIYPSPSYTLSAAIPPVPAQASPFSISSPSPPPPPPLPQPSPLPPPPPSSSCSPHTSPSPSPPSSPDRKSSRPPPPSLPSVQAFRLDTLQSVDPSDDPCPLSLNDLMIPSEEQEYQGHSYHFSLQSVSPPKPKPQASLTRSLITRKPTSQSVKVNLRCIPVPFVKSPFHARVVFAHI
ncbi:hypothetical protein BGW80DRAFT_90628 [Lactifluus volemus]|nr:hypothetical protein BGW80DRAFT_90628 [Lactifluus volemus]